MILKKLIEILQEFDKKVDGDIEIYVGGDFLDKVELHNVHTEKEEEWYVLIE